jgi:phage terminase Nu1 subunit (DNA packaging protein)
MESPQIESAGPGRPPDEPIRWTMERAAKEFGCDRKTLSKALTQRGEIAGDDGRYSTKQIADSLYIGVDLEKEQARLTKIRGDISTVQLARVRGEVIDTETVFRVWENIGVAIRRTILTSALTQAEKTHILNELKSFSEKSLVEFKKAEIEEGDDAS